MARLLKSANRFLVKPLVDQTSFVLKSSSRLAQSSVSDASVTPNKSNDHENTVIITDSCVNRLKRLGDDSILRVSVEGGGCSGFQTKFDLVETIESDDKVFEKDGVKVIIDSDSLSFLTGSTIDYEEELIRSSFTVAKNPQADQSCSCGVSFSLKDL
ncbi:iron-sulfur cluster assembly 2 homolog, mitochondrial [Octopus vulgaris]|uniref:Iron-sulfur cluster assembly 2 homolog, mitochondrial n=1 Tax=Octopus vulgaris TaxID=6645 RepID=A0AA36BNG7_OCTVU|nr:iron-sulfur cluster assembly 2 homolog, mitochondrial [Octopus vulgaris]